MTVGELKKALENARDDLQVFVPDDMAREGYSTPREAIIAKDGYFGISTYQKCDLVEAEYFMIGH